MFDTPKTTDRALGLTDRAVGVLGWLGAAAIAGLVSLIGIGVFFRYILNSPSRGMGDYTGLLLSVTIALSIAYGARRGAHVAVDVVNMVGGRKITRWTDVVVRVLGIGIIAFACVALVKNGQCGLLCAYTTSSLSIPLERFFYFMAAGLAAYGAVLAVELVVGLIHLWDDVDPSEKSSG